MENYREICIENYHYLSNFNKQIINSNINLTNFK